MPTGLLTLRKPMPVARSIHWVPVGAGSAPGGGVLAVDVPLFVTQGALREAMRHLRSDPEQELMGFLLGNLFECTNTGARYVVITSALRTGHVITEEEPVQIPEEEWSGMQLELRRRRAGLVGWYHSAPFVGPNPARLDLDTHRERFQEPWQTGLVIATGGPEPTGGLFRLMPHDSSAGGLFIPFDELVDDDGLLPGGGKRTLIDWSNYRTEQDVETDRTERRPHVSPTAPARPTAQARRPAVGADPGAAPPTLPVMLPEPIDLDETPAMPVTEGRRARRALLMVMVLGAAAAAGGLWWWNQRTGPEPGPGLSTDVFRSGRAARPAPASAAPSAPLDTTGVAGGAAGGGGALGADSTAASGVAGGTMTVAPGGGAPTSPVPNLAPNTTPNATTARPAASPAASPGTRPAPSADPQVARFDVLADSLEQAIRNFGDRSGDFAMKRLSCRGLGVGYRAADDAYIALAAAYRDARAVIDSARDARFRKLSSQIGGVNTAFDGSRCPRP